MEQIGFHQEYGKELRDKAVEHLIAWPEPALNLTLHERQRIMSEGLGPPLLRIVQLGTVEAAEDDVVLHHSHRPFAFGQREEILRLVRAGNVSLERYLSWTCSDPPAFDGDGFLERLPRFFLRAVNFLSCFSDVRSVHLALYFDGFRGAQLILNPHRERKRTVCVALRPVIRQETVSVECRPILVPELCTSLARLANEVLNSFRADGWMDYIDKEEFEPVYAKELSQLRFDRGILADDASAA